VASSTGSSIFEAALLASGLLTAEQLDDARRRLNDVGNQLPAEQLSRDDRLASLLIESGALNAWQVDQLKSGRTKFTLGPYRVIDSLGQGGMGQVFKAEHSLMGRIVAIKVLPLHKSTPDAVAYFTREMRAHAQLDHDNLVRAFDAGRDGNVYYLITEFVPGTDLRRLVRRRGRLSMPEAASIIAQAARGLQFAHDKGMIHRDVKPANILVAPDGRAKVSDVGLASFLDVENESDPRGGRIVGTADYLSPEHVRPPYQVSAASDIYSLGCTLFYAVTGEVPFPGGTIPQKARRHCEDAPPLASSIEPEIAADFSAVLARMLEKDPAKRIASGAHVAEALAPWLDPTPPAVGQNVPAQAIALVPPAANISLQQPTRRTPPWLAILGDRSWDELAEEFGTTVGRLKLLLYGATLCPLAVLLALLVLIIVRGL
jgi:eukaryotic-like serine/threonine-protein kinase